MRTPLRERVEAGAALLDRKRRSKTWRRKIDLKQLNLESCQDCILGQLYGGYSVGLDRLERNGEWIWPDELGFDPAATDHRPLTRAWCEYIEATR